MKMIFQEPQQVLSPLPRIQPQAGRRIGHYGVNARTIPSGGGHGGSNAFRVNPGPISRALRGALNVWGFRQDQAARQQADDYARRIQQEPQEKQWEGMRGDMAATQEALDSLDALGLPPGVNTEAITGQQQYEQPAGPGWSLKEMWEKQYPDFPEWKRTRPTHPGLDQDFFEKGKRNFDMHRGS